jgi:hypothetical protein
LNPNATPYNPSHVEDGKPETNADVEDGKPVGDGKPEELLIRCHKYI